MAGPIRSGEAFWLDNVPALDGTRPERRPVVVISDRDLLLADAGEEIVVATTTQEVPDADAVYLSHELSKPCWAVPRWTFVVRRERLTERAGVVTGPKLMELYEAVFGRSFQWPEDSSSEP